ncbi:MAG: pyridine nucleotide-disulfide oxidoreductase [Desulfatitalea sp. BRH_c12]|nr:MAG: pyridine nucleotide-disulfide oxidoreductase [Desulfatitalea sp. BRH_c12]
MKKDILIIGGGPAGMITALTAKSVYPHRSVCLIKDVGDGVIPCAIPYMIHTIPDPNQNIMGCGPLDKAEIETIIDKAIALNVEEKRIDLASGQSIFYDRLVLATGMMPAMPPVTGIRTPGVFGIEKSLSAMRTLRERCRQAERIVILGGGFIGAEFADEIARGSKAEVHVVEMMPKLLYFAFDDEFCDMIQQSLEEAGVHLHLNQRVVTIDGGEQVRSVTLEDGEKIPADLVIVGVGGKPNVALAAEAGLRITAGGSIWVDDYMRTNAQAIFAVGDCALKRDFFTRKEVPVWLASTATAEARIAGTNIYGIRVLRQIQGTIAAFSTKIGGKAFASAGLTCRGCGQEGFRWVCGRSIAPDRHPGTLPGAMPMHVKLVFADRAGTLLGGQAAGGESVGELINTIAVGIQKQLNVRELDMMQIATHPLLTSAPTVHPLINAAHMALAKLRGQASCP